MWLYAVFFGVLILPYCYTVLVCGFTVNRDEAMPLFSQKKDQDIQFRLLCMRKVVGICRSLDPFSHLEPQTLERMVVALDVAFHEVGCLQSVTGRFMLYPPYYQRNESCVSAFSLSVNDYIKLLVSRMKQCLFAYQHFSLSVSTPQLGSPRPSRALTLMESTPSRVSRTSGNSSLFVYGLPTRKESQTDREYAADFSNRYRQVPKPLVDRGRPKPAWH